MATARERLSQSRDMRQCPGCQATVTLADAIDEVANDVAEVKLHVAAWETRQSHAELESARQAAVLEGFRELIDSKFGEIKAVMKASNSILSSTAAGRDMTNSTPPGSSTLKLPGGTSWRAPSAIVAVVVLLSVMFAVLTAGAGVTAYYVVKSQATNAK